MLLLLLACGEKDVVDTEDTADPNAALLEELATALDGYESWTQAAEWSGVQESNTSHDAFTEIWFNDVSYATYEAQAGGDMPDGSVIAKQSWTDAEGTDPANFTAMMKADGEWFWAAYSPSGDVVQSGQPDFCTGCHAAGQDGVMVLTW